MIRSSILALTTTLALSACGSGTGGALGPNEVAIDFVNESLGGVTVFINGDAVGDVPAAGSRSFILLFGVYAVALDLRGDGETNRFPFQYVGLREGQRTLMVYRSPRGSRPLFADEAALDFRNDSADTVTVFLNGVDAGEVGPNSQETFTMDAGNYAVALDVLDARTHPFAFQFVGLQPGQRTAMTYR